VPKEVLLSSKQRPATPSAAAELLDRTIGAEAPFAREPVSRTLVRAARKFLQAAARDVEGGVNRHGSIFTLGSSFQVFRVLPGFGTSQLSPRRRVLGGNA